MISCLIIRSNEIRAIRAIIQNTMYWRGQREKTAATTTHLLK